MMDREEMASEIIAAIARMVADGESITISEDWGYGTATLTLASGAHTHVGGDWGASKDDNLMMLIEGLHDMLVKGRGLSWHKDTCKGIE